MKQITALILMFISTCIGAQTVVTLNVNQPTELGFEIGVTDTTIVRGDSITLGKDLSVFGGSGEFTFKWTSGETLNDSTLMNPIAFPTDTTTYLLTVSDLSGCSFSLSYKVNVKTVTALTNYKLNNQTLVAILFPNPTSSSFKVQLKGEPQDKIEMTVIDVSGRTLKKQVINNFTGEHTEVLNLDLPKGLYNLSIVYNYQRINREFIIN